VCYANSRSWVILSGGLTGILVVAISAKSPQRAHRGPAPIPTLETPAYPAGRT